MAVPSVVGNTTGLQPNFLNSVLAAAGSLGATQVIINSGYRSPEHNAAVGGVSRSNHLTGQAIDGYAVINGQRIPLGTALKPVVGRYGLRSGDVPGFYHGARDPVHVDNAANLGGVKTLPWTGGSTGATFIPNAPAGGVGSASPLNTWHPNAQLAYTLGVQAGLTPAQATDFAAVQWGESGFDQNIVNKKSGAAGLYQLLSSGYVNKANQLGGVFNPRANILAILPDYVRYYKSHPTLVPGAAGAAVELSGEGPAFYAAGYQHLGSGVPTTGGSLTGGSFASTGGNVSTSPSVVGSISPGSVGATATGQTVTPFSTGASVVGASGGVSTVAAPKPTIVHPANRPSYFQSPYGPRPGMTKPTAPSSGGAGGKNGGGRAAAPFDWQGLIDQVSKPVDLTPYTKIANTQAAAATARLIAGIHADQEAARSAAALRATQQTSAGLAAAKYLEGLHLGDQTMSDYERAAAAERTAAQGFSGGLQQTVSDAAAQVQRNLETIGSPQTATNQGAAAGNVLYGLGGYLPSQQLDVVGPAVAAGLRAQPGQLLGYGQTLAAGQLSLGEQEAAKLTPEITKARVNQATLAAQYLDTLSDAALKAGSERTANLFKILGAKQKQDAADALAAWRYDQSHKPQIIHSGGDVFVYNPATGKTTQTIRGAQTLPKPFQFGGSMWQIDPATGQPVEILRGGAGAGKALTPHTDKFGRTYTVDANGNVHILSSGIYTDPATNTTYTVGIDGTMTVFGQGTPSGNKPSPLQSVTLPDGTVAVFDPNTGTYTAGPAGHNKPDALKPPPSFTVGGVRYAWQLDPKTKTWRAVPVTKPAPGGGRPPSASTIKSLQEDIRAWYTGQTGLSGGKPVTDPSAQLTWLQAVNQASERVPRARAIRMVTAVFGKPIDIAADSVTTMKGNGNILITALTNILTDASAGDLEVPTDYYLQAVARVYGRSLKFVRSTFQQMIKAQRAGGANFSSNATSRATAAVTAAPPGSVTTVPPSLIGGAPAGTSSLFTPGTGTPSLFGP